MEFILYRDTILQTRTFGKLYFINGNANEFIGHTLEDKVRDNGDFAYGETAIPYGRYRLIVSFSNRFKKQMIQIINVHSGDIKFHNVNIDSCGIRIHGGNTENDSLGCILLGAKRMDNEKIYECSKVNDDLLNQVKFWDMESEVYLTIEKKEINV
ncbi:MAG: hypothetical protein IT243_05965 [Bacteroidia bacterium]|nr:hypothetical protein [Bacteroidia bacterium]